MDARAAVGIFLAGIVAALWAWLRIGSAKPSAAPGPVDNTKADDSARRAIKSAGATVDAEISADLKGRDPAGALADRANRRRR